MAGLRVFSLLELATLRSIDFLSVKGFSVHSFGSSMKIYAFPYSNRFLSTTRCLSGDSTDSKFTNRDASEAETTSDDLERSKKRTDLDRLKRLLFQRTAESQHLHDKGDNVSFRADSKKSKPVKKSKKPPVPAVNVAQFMDLLSTLKPKTDAFPDDTGHSRTSKDKESKAAKSKPDTKVKSKLHTVEAESFKKVLSDLDQDMGRSTSEEVISAKRQLSSDEMSAIEGAYTIKQQQLQDKAKSKKLLHSSLRDGPRFHMFDEAKKKWSREENVLKNIFQEMAEKEIKDLGIAATIQSGFHDLMENAHRQWPFPIDNEICKEEEDGVGFDEHVFLEHMLSDFPVGGNVRQFMELVVTGLQQNPYLTVQEKHYHIEWFKDYFENIPDEQVQV